MTALLGAAILASSANPASASGLIAGVRGGDWDIPVPHTSPIDTPKSGPTLSQAEFEKLIGLVKQNGAKSMISPKGASMLALSRPGEEWPARELGRADQDAYHAIHVGDADSSQVVFVRISGDVFTLLRVDRALHLVSALRWTKGVDDAPVRLAAPAASTVLGQELAFWAQAVD